MYKLYTSSNPQIRLFLKENRAKQKTYWTKKTSKIKQRKNKNRHKTVLAIWIFYLLFFWGFYFFIPFNPCFPSVFTVTLVYLFSSQHKSVTKVFFPMCNSFHVTHVFLILSICLFVADLILTSFFVICLIAIIKSLYKYVSDLRDSAFGGIPKSKFWGPMEGLIFFQNHSV